MTIKKTILWIALFLVAIIGIIGVWGYMSSQVEQSPYTIVSQNGTIELRDYPRAIALESS